MKIESHIRAKSANFLKLYLSACYWPQIFNGREKDTKAVAFTVEEITVNENLVMLVEVHVLDPQSGQLHWFEDRQLQEVVYLVKEAIESRLAQTKTTVKGAQQNSAIVTGDSLRLGYVFKTRPNSQHCLVPTGCLTLQEQQELEEGDLQSLAVAKEKLVIYACQRQAGSPQGMSQLVRVMGEKTNSISKGVSISSYFQKVSGGNQSGPSSTSSSPAPPSAVPKSGGKRNILKKIIQKGDTNVSSKRKKSSKASTARRESSIHQFLKKDNDTETNCLPANTKGVLEDNTKPLREIKDETVNKASNVTVDSALEKAGNVSLYKTTNDGQFETDKLQMSEDTKTYEVSVKAIKAKSENISDEEAKTIEPEHTTVRISQVFNTPVPLKSEGNVSAGSVTLIGVDQMHEIQQQKLPPRLLPEGRHSVVSLVNATESQSQDKSCDESNSHSDIDADESILPSASFVSQPRNGLHSPSNCAYMCNMQKTGQQKVKEHVNASSSVDTLSDSADSPIFSKKKTEKVISANTPDAADKTKNNVSEEPSVLTSLKIEKLHTLKYDKGKTRLKTNLPEFSDSESDNETNYHDKSKSRNKRNVAKSQTGKSYKENRLKRKLSDFSDSDSENSNNLPSISRIQKPQNKKFVRLDEMKQNSKKYSISKSFFSGKDEKLQPTLSFFMSDKSKKTATGKKDASESQLNKEELENLDCTLIEELSSAVEVIGETDSEIKREIRDLREVDELNEEHLNFMVQHSEPYLRNIFEGKIHSSRHMDYKKGGISKRDLNYKSCLNLYSEEQIDVVMEALMKIFCKRHHKYLDYIMKVLLPEMLIKFHMEIHSLSKEESERRLLP